MADHPLEPDLRAALEARRELGAELEPQVIEGFVERIEKRIDQRIDERLRGAPVKRERDKELALAIISLGVSIPLIAIAGSSAGLPGVVAVCAALVLLNVFFRR